MPSLYAEIEINAPRAAVWDALVRKRDWLYWNTYLYDRSPERHFRQGETVKLWLKRESRETETEIEPLITLVQPDVSLQWMYTAPGFRCQHGFELQEVGRNRTRYTHRVRFSGALSSLFLPFIRKEEQRGLRRMAQELKRYVEKY